MESTWVHLFVGVLSVAGLFGAALVGGALMAYAPLRRPSHQSSPVNQIR